MSEFNFYGNVHGVNQQLGDKNSMNVSEQEVEIDWKVLQKEFEELDRRANDKEEKSFVRKCLILIDRKNKNGLKSFLKKNFGDFSKGILSSLAASAMIEVIKILL